MAYLDLKGEGDNSMPLKRRPCPGVRGARFRGNARMPVLAAPAVVAAVPARQGRQRLLARDLLPRRPDRVGLHRHAGDRPGQVRPGHARPRLAVLSPPPPGDAGRKRTAAGHPGRRAVSAVRLRRDRIADSQRHSHRRRPATGPLRPHPPARPDHPVGSGRRLACQRPPAGARQQTGAPTAGGSRDGPIAASDMAGSAACRALHFRVGSPGRGALHHDGPLSGTVGHLSSSVSCLGVGWGHSGRGLPREGASPGQRLRSRRDTRS
jgi:hypothetical protein